MRNNQEHYEQVALFGWIDLHKKRYRGLDLVFAVPNAARRSPRQGKWMKDEGMRAGVPDVVVPIARDGCNSLWIELKVGKNKPTKIQADFHERLREEGHRVEVCYGWEEARDILVDYLEREVV